jgi:hypothetical protein
LVTLASAFVIAPAGLVAVLKDRATAGLTNSALLWLFVVAEILFIASVLAGYVVFGTIAGYQAADKFDVYRPATMYASLGQIATYLIGLVVFMFFAVLLSSAGPIGAAKP